MLGAIIISFHLTPSKRRDKRLFQDKARFIKHNASNKIESTIRDIDIIHHYLLQNDSVQVANKQKHIAAQGLKPPKTEKECKQMIKDLRQWQE